jgi:hypothetical protein
MENIRLTNGTEFFTCTVTATDEQGPAELMDNNGAKYYHDYNGGWTSDAAEESVTAIEAGETDEAAKERLLLEVGEKCEDCAARFLAKDGFCADDMVLCRACSIKYAEEHPDEVQATGRSF